MYKREYKSYRIVPIFLFCLGLFLVSGSNCNPGGTYNPGPGGADESLETCCSELPRQGL